MTIEERLKRLEEALFGEKITEQDIIKYEYEQALLSLLYGDRKPLEEFIKKYGSIKKALQGGV